MSTKQKIVATLVPSPKFDLHIPPPASLTSCDPQLFQGMEVGYSKFFATPEELTTRQINHHMSILRNAAVRQTKGRVTCRRETSAEGTTGIRVWRVA